jgi:hypothetical protein
MPTALGTVASAKINTSAGPIPTTGLVGWWDASDAASITATAGKVSQWSNKVGAPHWTQTDAQYHPLTGVNTMNGKNTLTFPGGNNARLDLASNPCTGAAGGTLFWVVKNTRPNTAPSGAPVSGLGANGTDEFYTYVDSRPYFRFGSTVRTTMNVTADLRTAHVAALRAAPNSWEWWRDGVSQYSNTSNVVGWATDPTGIHLGYSAGAADYVGDIAEVILYNQALSTVERQQVESYLAAKWLPAPPIPTTGLVGWWDADDTASFTFGGGGNLVSQWNDKSGNGYNATWVNSSWPATRVAAAINGKPGMDFHPAALNTLVPGNLKPITVILAVKTGATTGGNNLLGHAFTGAGESGFFTVDHSSGYVRVLAYGVALIGQATSPYTANTPTVLAVSYGADNVWAMHRDAVAVGTGTTAATFVDKKLAIGGIVPNTSLYDGLIGELVVYNRVLSTVERQQVEAFLKGKWGTP